MSFYSIAKSIFKNQEYNAVLAWYDKAFKESESLVWKEFVKRTSTNESDDSFEYKECLYGKRAILDALKGLYSKCSEICSQYPHATEVWMKENGIDSTPLSFFEREKLIRGEGEIHRIYLYHQIAIKYKVGLSSFLTDNPNINVDIKEGRKLVLDAVNQIEHRERVFESYQQIAKTNNIGLLSFLTDHPNIDIETNEGRELILESLCQIEHREQVFKKFEDVREKYKTGLNSFLSEMPNVDLNIYVGWLLVVNTESEIKEREKVLREYDNLLVTYSEGMSAFRSINANIDITTYRGKKYVIDNKADVIYCQTIFQDYNELKKKYKEGLQYYLGVNTWIPIDRYEGILRVVNSQNIIADFDTCIKKYKSIVRKYSEAYNIFLEENGTLDVDSIDGKKYITDKKPEILQINRTIEEFKEVQESKDFLETYICFFNLNFIPQSFSYSSKKKVVEHKSELKELQRDLRQIKNFERLYPQAYPLLLLAHEDKSLTHIFVDNPILRLNRSKIHYIAHSEEDIKITETYITIAGKYTTIAMQYLCPKTRFGNFTKEGIKRKQEFIHYDELVLNRKKSELLNLECDIDDIDTKARCILSSESYGNKVQFADTYNIVNFYKLSRRIKGYSQTFDEILSYRSKHGKAIKSFNQIHRGGYAFYINDFDLIGSKNKSLFDWIQTEENKERVLSVALQKVKEIREAYPQGYKLILQKENLNENSLSLEQANFLIEKKDLICETEQIICAREIMSLYPDGVMEVLKIARNRTISPLDAQRILNNKTSIISTQQSIKERRVREERLKNNALNIYNNYRKGYEYYVSEGRIKSWYSCSTTLDYQTVIELESSIKEKQYWFERIEKIERCVQGWHVTRYGISHDYLYEYLKTKAPREATQGEWDNRYLIWAFKNTPNKYNSKYSYEEALGIIVPKYTRRLKETFGSMASDLTLVCIPASNKVNNERRWKEFSSRVCNELNMWNGYSYISIESDAMAKSLGGDGITTLSFDRSFFKGKQVVLCDDIKTSGKSLQRMRQQLESMGATVVCALTIGVTVHE